MFFFFFKLKTAYEMRISDWSSDVCSSDLKTLLSKHMLVNPLSMLIESKKFPISVLHRTYIDERALVTTPYHRALNRLREAARGADCHGSCGMGIGETMADALERADAIRVADLMDDGKLNEKQIGRALCRERVCQYV